LIAVVCGAAWCGRSALLLQISPLGCHGGPHELEAAGQWPRSRQVEGEAHVRTDHQLCLLWCGVVCGLAALRLVRAALLVARQRAAHSPALQRQATRGGARQDWLGAREAVA